MLAAKFGARSCGFWLLVMVAAPLKPRESVISRMHMRGLFSMKQKPNSRIPGIMCASKRKLSCKLTLVKWSLTENTKEFSDFCRPDAALH